MNTLSISATRYIDPVYSQYYSRGTMSWHRYWRQLYPLTTLGVKCFYGTKYALGISNSISLSAKGIDNPIDSCGSKSTLYSK